MARGEDGTGDMKRTKGSWFESNLKLKWLLQGTRDGLGGTNLKLNEWVQ